MNVQQLTSEAISVMATCGIRYILTDFSIIVSGCQSLFSLVRYDNNYTLCVYCMLQFRVFIHIMIKCA